MLKAHQNRMGSSIEHFLLQCTLYDELCQVLKQEVKEVWERCKSRRSLTVWIYLCNSYCFLLPVISLHTSNAVTFCQEGLITSRTLRDSCNTLSSLHISSSSIQHHYHIDHISEDNLRTNSDLSEKVTLQESINTVEVLLCIRYIILEVIESWKLA